MSLFGSFNSISSTSLLRTSSEFSDFNITFVNSEEILEEDSQDTRNDLIDEVINLTIFACLGVIKLFENSTGYSEMRSLMYL